MATSFTPITIISPASSTHRKKASVTASASGKRWTPIFRWSSDPDYIQNPTTTVTDGYVTQISDLDKGDQCRSRFTPGSFKEEKAKQLRMKIVEMVNFHDIMYHSAIASRLASDVSAHYDR